MTRARQYYDADHDLSLSLFLVVGDDDDDDDIGILQDSTDKARRADANRNLTEEKEDGYFSTFERRLKMPRKIILENNASVKLKIPLYHCHNVVSSQWCGYFITFICALYLLLSRSFRTVLCKYLI